MRTTLNIDDDLLAVAKCIASERAISIGRAFSNLARRGLEPRPHVFNVTEDGIPVFRVSADSPIITLEDVKRTE